MSDEQRADGWRGRFGSKIGIWTLALEGIEIRQAMDQAKIVEELGFDSLFFGEAYGREAFVNSTLLLGATSNLIIGTGIANIYARDAMAANAAARTINDAFPGRFIMGLGVSHLPLVERFRGHTYQNPIDTMSSYLEALDKATFMAKGPGDRPTRIIAALGPKMLELSREMADGAHPYLVTPAHTEMARKILGSDRLLVVEQAVALTNDRDEFLRRAHSHLEFYSGLPNYRNSWKRQGYSDEDFVRGGSEKLKDALVTFGDEEAAGRMIQAHFDAGADQVLLQLLGEDMTKPPAEDWKRMSDYLQLTRR